MYKLYILYRKIGIQCTSISGSRTMKALQKPLTCFSGRSFATKPPGRH